MTTPSLGGSPPTTLELNFADFTHQPKVDGAPGYYRRPSHKFAIVSAIELVCFDSAAANVGARA